MISHAHNKQKAFVHTQRSDSFVNTKRFTTEVDMIIFSKHCLNDNVMFLTKH